MTSLACAAAFFVAIHLLVSGTRLRGAVIAATGERAFRGVFSLLSVAGIVWLCRAYASAPLVPLWGPVVALRWPALILQAVAFLLAAIGVSTPNPTAVGGEPLLEKAEPARGILRVTRHPLLWGIATWAAAHLAVTGDAAAVLLFGTLLAVALLGPPLIDAKRRRAAAAAWSRFAAVTSSVPFAAILAGRNRFVPAEIGWMPIAVGLGLFAAFLTTHAWLFGVSPYPL